MDNPPIEKINSLLTGVSRTEFFAEQILNHFHLDSRIILECLSLFELAKFYLKLKKYTESKDRFILSEELTTVKENAEEKKKEKQIEKLFFKKEEQISTITDADKLKSKIAKMLQRIKTNENQFRNAIFQDTLERSSKDMNILSNLPIPEKIKGQVIVNSRVKRIRIGEAIHMIRPLVYCLSQIVFGVNSYKPYIISLVLDLIRLLLQFRVEFYDAKEVDENRLRKKDLIINYLLRNPVYTDIVKNKILIPLMNKLFPNFKFLQKVIIYIIEAKFFKELKLEDTACSIDFSPSGDLFAVGLLDERVLVWKTEYDTISEKKPTMVFENHNMGVVDLKFNSLGNRLAVSSMDSTLKVWNVDEKMLVSEIQCKPMENWKLAFNPDGKEIVTAGELGKIQGFDIETKDLITSLKSADIFATCVAYSNNGKFIAIGNNVGNIFVYDMKNDKKMQKIEAHKKLIRDIKFTADNTRLVSVSDDFTISIFDLIKFQKYVDLAGHKGNINTVDCHPTDKTKIVTGSYDRTVKVWDIEQRTCLHTITYNDNVWSVKFSHDGTIIGATTDSGLVSLYKL